MRHESRAKRSSERKHRAAVHSASAAVRSEMAIRPDTKLRAGRRRRDRRGRGVRGRLAPVDVPLHRTRGEQFDELVMDAVDELGHHWGADLGGLEFAVEDVPPRAADLGGRRGAAHDVVGGELTADTVVDRGVALGRLFRGGLDDIREPVVVIYRRPVEARASDPDDRADLVFMVVADLAAEFLGRDIDDIDPPY